MAELHSVPQPIVIGVCDDEAAQAEEEVHRQGRGAEEAPVFGSAEREMMQDHEQSGQATKTVQEYVPHRAARRISLCCSRCQSRSFSVSRLSYCFLPLASPICSFTRPFA